ncbi:MAG: hypothetical protein HY720_08815 [Planctomycetes bacterium]|nr:hypothetical protein [Planctomycetota bacterium]
MTHLRRASFVLFLASFGAFLISYLFPYEQAVVLTPTEGASAKQKVEGSLARERDPRDIGLLLLGMGGALLAWSGVPQKKPA